VVFFLSFRLKNTTGRIKKKKTGIYYKGRGGGGGEGNSLCHRGPHSAHCA